jgi:hypothetical protein
MRSFILTCLLAVLSFSAAAQIDAKLNLGPLILGGINVGADVGLSENTSLGLSAGYLSSKLGSDNFRYSNLLFVPEYRYYFNPRRGVDGFFAGGYGKLTFTTAEELDSSEPDLSATRGALGVVFGNKWVTEGGFVFELNFGLGRGTTFGSKNEAEAAFNTLTALDIRIGIIVGYRFNN